MFVQQLRVALPAKAHGVAQKLREYSRHYPMPISNLRGYTRYAMDGSSFTIPSEPPGAEPHAGVVVGGG